MFIGLREIAQNKCATTIDKQFPHRKFISVRKDINNNKTQPSPHYLFENILKDDNEFADEVTNSERILALDSPEIDPPSFVTMNRKERRN